MADFFEPEVLEMTHVAGFVVGDGDPDVTGNIPHAYVVTGLPKIGETVRHRDGLIGKVVGGRIMLRLESRGLWRAADCRPYDPVGALVEEVADVIGGKTGCTFDDAVAAARIAIAAVREADNG